jgi:6-phosphogluconolactonase
MLIKSAPKLWPKTFACAISLAISFLLFACGGGGTSLPSFGVGGTVSGLNPGTSVVLSTNGVSKTVSANGAFIFGTVIPQGSSYNVTVGTQPAWQNCVVTNGSGTNITANALSASVVCSAVQYAYVASYTNSQLWHYSVNATTGVLTPTVFSETDGNPSGIAVAGNFAYVTHFSTNKISQYSIDPATGHLGEVTSAATRYATGNNPNGIVISPSGSFAYVSNGGHNSISKYAINATTGVLTEVTSFATRFPTGVAPNGLTLSPNGSFLYVTNNGSNTGTTLSTFSVDSAGDLTALATVAAGTGPTGVSLAASGNYAYVSNYGGNTITQYAANPATGTLTIGASVATGANPAGFAVSPFGNFAYALNWTDNTVSQYSINPSTGALTVISGTPATGVTPDGIAFR